jgi:hypothetical protein
VVLSREDRFLPKMKFESIFFQVLGRFLETVINKRRLDGEWRCRKPNFPTGGVCSKKFEQISSKICRASGIPPQKKPFHQLAEATLSDLPAGRQASRQVGRFQVFHSAFSGTPSFARFGCGYFHITSTFRRR